MKVFFTGDYFRFTCAMLSRNCAMRFGRVARVLLSPLCFFLLSFSFRNRDFSKGYGRKK
jgi:hypothetical protein